MGANVISRRIGFLVNVVGLVMTVLALLIRTPPEAALLLGFVASIPYGIMIFVHARLCITRTQRAVALVASLIVSAAGLWFVLVAVIAPPEVNYTVAFGLAGILGLQAFAAIPALIICAFIWRARWHEARHRRVPQVSRCLTSVRADAKEA
jgi:hypothetical protein